MDHTTNHQLSQWENTDRVLMEDFNADNAKIDAALRAEADARAAADAELSAQMSKLGHCQIYHYQYTGVAGGKTLTFPSKPLLVLLSDSSGFASVCIYGAPYARALGSSSGTSFRLTWGENSLTWNDYQMNGGGTYYAAAFISME